MIGQSRSVMEGKFNRFICSTVKFKMLPSCIIVTKFLIAIMAFWSVKNTAKSATF